MSLSVELMDLDNRLAQVQGRLRETVGALSPKQTDKAVECGRLFSLMVALRREIDGFSVR